MTIEEVSEVIKEARPNIKDNTIRMYATNLNKLRKSFDTEEYKFLTSIDQVKAKLTEYHYTTQRNYYNSIIIFLMAINDKNELNKVIEEYNELRDSLNKQYEDENATGVISDKQKRNFIKLEEVNKMISEMGEDIRINKLKKKGEISAKEKQLIMVYILFNIYTRLPMRNDVAGMESITKRQYNTLSEEDKKERNYLIVEKNRMKFVVNQFKTSSKYKELNIDIPKDLEKYLRVWLRINGMGVLFKSTTDKPLTRNALSQLLIRTSKKYLNKSISTTMLRKIVLSDKFVEVKKEQQEMAEVTGHSVETMNKIYVKEDQEENPKEEV